MDGNMSNGFETILCGGLISFILVICVGIYHHYDTNSIIKNVTYFIFSILWYGIFR